MFGKSAFGSSGGFGQQPQQTSVFGQQPQQQPSAFGGFGSTSTPATFGSTANTSTSAFGQPAQTSAFGSGATTGGFGTSTGSAFGQARPSAFGGSCAFGTTQQPATTGFGGFGSSTGTTSAFGSTTTQTGGGLFGQSRPSAFGTTTTSAPSAFGASTTTPTAFGTQTQTGFGSLGQTSAFGQPVGGTNQGTAIADFTPTQDRDATSGVNNFFQTITAMPQYRNFSLEELRLQDYMQNRKNAGAAATTGFGSTATGGFGTGTGAFGQPATATPFGQQTTSAFGQPQTSSAFGSTNTGTGLFGQTQQTGTTGFGTSSTGGFGTSGFGTNTSTAFGGTGTGGFGAAANIAAKPLFGSTQTGTSGFGTSTTPAFGQSTTGTTGFGQTNQQQTGFGGFGQKPAGTTTTGGFGGFGTGFGSTATSKPATSFSFNPAGTQTGTTGTTGFGGFGGTGTGTTGFGTTQTSQGGGLFGANKPATGGPSLFGGNQTQTTGTTFGSFGTGQTGGFGTSGGGLFGQKPAGTTGTTSLFGNTQGTGTGFGGFGTQQTSGTGTFSLPTTGGLTSFGASGLQAGQQQQPLIATVDKNPYGTNPLFDTSKQPTSGAKTGPSAVALESPGKKPTSPHYPMAPRVVSKIKLRGFAFTPTSRTATKKMSSLEGIDDSAVLGVGAFTPRPSNKKLVFDKVTTDDISALVNKKTTTPKTLFDPKLELVASKKKETKSAAEQTARPSSASSSSTMNDVPPAALSAASSRHGYYSSPTLEALESMTEEELKHVENFVVGRQGYGEIRFKKPVDLSKYDVHEIMGKLVIIEERTVVVYPDESEKPPEGQGLNVPAVVKLERCYSIDKDTKQPIKDPEHPRAKMFAAKLRNREGVKFIDYDINRGIWEFEVERF